MDDRLSRLESKISDLTQTIGTLEHRLAALEGLSGAGAAEAETPFPAASIGAGALAAPAPYDLVGVLSLLGRLFIVLGGAYLLRAMTESGHLRPEVGILACLAYAVLWMVTADRAAHRGQKLAADFHGVATALIAFPLVWEGNLETAAGPLDAPDAMAIMTGVRFAATRMWRRGCPVTGVP